VKLSERRVQPQVPKGNKIGGSPPFKNLASWSPDRKVKNRQHGKQSVHINPRRRGHDSGVHIFFILFYTNLNKPQLSYFYSNLSPIKSSLADCWRSQRARLNLTCLRRQSYPRSFLDTVPLSCYFLIRVDIPIGGYR